MSKQIWKFPLRIADNQSVTMPKGAEILTVQVQHNIPCLWAKVDPEAEKVDRHIITHGTGHEVRDDVGAYIGTYQYEDSLVFHVFDRGRT